MTANGILSCREQQHLTAISGKRVKSTCLKKINLQHLVMHPNFFMVFGVTLRKFIDFDPKLLDFPFDLSHTNTSGQLFDIKGKMTKCGSPSYFWPYLLLLYGHLRRCHAVSFGQHRNYIDFSLQGHHTLHVQRSEAATHTNMCEHSDSHLLLWHQRGSDLSVPVAERGDEVQAAVDSVVLDVPPVQAALISKILLKLLVDVVLYALPADGQT